MALKTYKQLAKDFGIGDDELTSTEAQLNWARTQQSELKTLVHRQLFDATIATQKLESAEGKLEKQAHEKKVREYTEELDQFKQTLKIVSQLVKELEAELSGE